MYYKNFDSDFTLGIYNLVHNKSIERIILGDDIKLLLNTTLIKMAISSLAKL